MVHERAVDAAPEWWRKPRNVTVVTDKLSWFQHFAQELVRRINSNGDEALLVSQYDAIKSGAVAFFIGCTSLASPEILALNNRTLVVHESDLPRGRGFSPLTWQILEGHNEIPICLLEASDEADGGHVVYRDTMVFDGHEMIDDLRAVQAQKTLELCQRYLDSPLPPEGVPQVGDPDYYARRRPCDSRIDPSLSVVEQFALLRVVDNERYPAYFDHLGQRYQIQIRKICGTDK